MKNVRLHVASGVVLAIAILRGDMVSTVAGQPPVFDDQRSYVLHVHFGEVVMDMASLTRLMNDHVFAYDGAPLSNVEEAEGRWELRATLHKGVPLPVSMVASVHPVPGAGGLKTYMPDLEDLTADGQALSPN